MKVLEEKLKKLGNNRIGLPESWTKEVGISKYGYMKVQKIETKSGEICILIRTDMKEDSKKTASIPEEDMGNVFENYDKDFDKYMER